MDKPESKNEWQGVLDRPPVGRDATCRIVKTKLHRSMTPFHEIILKNILNYLLTQKSLALFIFLIKFEDYIHTN
ncbi:hypothetical protein H8E88_07045 [candidate division KSB1 bacterium]|nr:hypothetical protein [candidate division KSB1 bacterium]MBL7092647.1 hypothetical protein [candidate division KSB1 bacterium]